MQRRRSQPHTFEQNIAAEKAKLEAALAKLRPGPEMEAIRKKIRQLDTRRPYERVAAVARSQSPTIARCAMGGYYAYLIGDDGEIADRIEILSAALID